MGSDSVNVRPRGVGAAGAREDQAAPPPRCSGTATGGVVGATTAAACAADHATSYAGSARPATTTTGGEFADSARTVKSAFSGTIVRVGSRYVLKVSDATTYQFDDQDNAKRYEGKEVKIVGSLEAKTNLLHVTSIELLS